LTVWPRILENALSKGLARYLAGTLGFGLDRSARYLAGTLGFGPRPFGGSVSNGLARYLAGTSDLA